MALGIVAILVALFFSPPLEPLRAIVAERTAGAWGGLRDFIAEAKATHDAFVDTLEETGRSLEEAKRQMDTINNASHPHGEDATSGASPGPVTP